MQKSTSLNGDDVRFVVTLARRGTLSATARELGVDHTTVSRRIEAAEHALDTRLFTRSPAGYTLTVDGTRLLPGMRRAVEALLAVEREAAAADAAMQGVVRVTSPETFGMAWLAPRLAGFALLHPGLTVVLDPSGSVLDLGRGEAEIAVRSVRSRAQRLVVKRVAEVGYGLYATPTFLAANPVRSAIELLDRPLLTGPDDQPEGRWLARIAPGVTPTFVSELSLSLQAAARAHAGIAVLPRFLGDADPDLRRIAMGAEPTETLWLTVHEDARAIPRVRALLDALVQAFRDDAEALLGHARAPATGSP